MAVGTEVVAIRYEDIVAGTPISVPYPLYEALDVQVYYGFAALLAVYNTDYTITLGDDFDTFTLTPTASLLTKINDLIAGDPTHEVNYITVRRRLDYLTDTTAAAVRYTPFTSREFERTVLRFQQIQEQLNRSLTLSPNFVGSVALTVPVPEAGRALIWNEEADGLENGPTAQDVSDAQANAAAALQAKTDTEALKTDVQNLLDGATGEMSRKLGYSETPVDAPYDAGGRRITGLADPTDPTDAVPMGFVQSLVAVAVVATRTELASYDTSHLVYLLEAGHEGIFVRNDTDLSAEVTIDTQQGVYVPPTSDTSGVSGAWVRQFKGDLWAQWFGLKSTNTGTQNVVAINAAIMLGQNLKAGVALPVGEFDIAVTGNPNGIKLVSNTRLRGMGSRATILNLVGNSTNTQIDAYTAGSGIGRDYTPGVANGGVNNALVEDLAVVMNHPGDSINTAVCLQVGVDFRNINRSTLRRCWVGNYHPRLNTKGFTQDFLAQGYAVLLGGKPGGNVDYAHQECNIIEENTILGAFIGVAIEGRAVDTGPAYNTTVRKNDIQTCHTLIYQGLASGAGNVIKENVLQNLVHPNGNANPTRGIFMAGYGNIVEEAYGEYGSDAQYILYLAPSARRNWIKYSGTCTVASGLIGSFVDNGGASSYNVIYYFDNTGAGGTWNSQGAPMRRISNVATAMT